MTSTVGCCHICHRRCTAHPDGLCGYCRKALRRFPDRREYDESDLVLDGGEWVRDGLVKRWRGKVP